MNLCLCEVLVESREMSGNGGEFTSTWFHSESESCGRFVGDSFGSLSMAHTNLFA